MAQPHRDEEFWFDDGTVILIASNVEFRVYKSTLSEHSIVSSNKFALPQPSSDARSHEYGCPIVHPDDSAAGLLEFLRVLFLKKDARRAGFLPWYDASYLRCTADSST